MCVYQFFRWGDWGQIYHTRMIHFEDKNKNVIRGFTYNNLLVSKCAKVDVQHTKKEEEEEGWWGDRHGSLECKA